MNTGPRNMANWAGVVLLAAGLCSGTLRSQAPAKKPMGPSNPPAKTSQKPAPTPAPTAPAKLEPLKIPADAILIICKGVQNALELAPNGYVLSREEYQKLLNRIDTLERQAKPARAIPSSCKLNGQVDGDLIRLQAQFDFSTERPRTLVSLGCQRAFLRSANIDGRLPLFAVVPAEDGLVVQVDTPGIHQVNLELAIPLAARGAKGERGFDLGLPRAAITTLEQFTFPPGATETRVNGRPLKTRSLALGGVDRLEIVWKGPAQAPARGRAMLAAEGNKITVRLEDKTITTDVELNLQVLRGETKQWRILMPPGVIPELKEPLPQDERIEGKTDPTPKQPWLTLRLKEASAAPLRVAFRITQARKGGTVSVGPFLVLDTFRQRGTLLVRAPADLRLRFHPKGDVQPREVTEEMHRDKVVAAFHYGNMNAPSDPTKPVASFMDLDVEPIKGAIETRVEHTLQQTENGFQVLTKIDVTPVRMGLEQLELKVPAEYSRWFDRERGAAPASLVEEVRFDDKAGTAIVRFAEKQFAPVSITLPAFYPVAAGRKQLVAELPRPLQTLDRGAQATVVLSEGQTLAVQAPKLDVPPGTKRHSWRWDRAPAQFEVGWTAYQPELPVHVVADMTLVGTQARVRQQLDFQFPGAAPASVLLQIPERLSEHVRVVRGGLLGANGQVKLDRPGRNVTVVLEYSVPVEAVPGGDTAQARVFAVPLVRALQGTRVETKVRIWSEPGAMIETAGDAPWDVLPIETAERASLPTLVLRTGQAQAPLLLRQVRANDAALAPVVIDRALIRVVLTEEGYQHYHARFLLRRLGAHHFDLELPAPLSTLGLEVSLDHKKVPQLQALDTNGKVAENGTMLRLGIEPELYQKPVILELDYQLAPGRTRGNGLFYSTLQPPLPHGDVFIGRVRWQIDIPSRWLAVSLEGLGTEQRWDWQAGLLRPRPAQTGDDLARWLGDGADNTDSETTEAVATGLVCARSDLESFKIVQMPQQVWLLVCSMLFLVVGLTLTFAALPRWLFWSSVTLLGLLVAAVGTGWPGVVPAVLYGCEPGAAVLLLIIVAQWLLQSHYRRQVVFLPGFTRVKSAPPLLRDGVAVKARAEPSTVDQPRKQESKNR